MAPLLVVVVLQLLYTVSGGPRGVGERYRYASCTFGDSTISLDVRMRQKITYGYGFFHAPLEVTVRAAGSTIKDGLHGIHVHKYWAMGTKGACARAGGHYNPLNTQHGDIGDQPTRRHVGDWGNVPARNGALNVKFADTLASLSGTLSITGRGLVLHDGEDDLGRGGDAGSATTGNAGKRLVCCIVAVTDEEGFRS